MAGWVKSDEAVRAATVAAVVTEPAPQLPESLEKCLKRSLRPKQVQTVGKAKSPADAKQEPSKEAPQASTPSADALVLAAEKTKRDREACAYQLLKWHQDQQVKTAAKTAAVK